MASNDLERYLNDLKTDAGLQSELAKASSGNDIVASVIRTAKTRGYTLTEEEVRAHINSMTGERELSESELNTVDGGVMLWTAATCDVGILTC